MTTQEPTFEIVQFAFADGMPVDEQRDAMRTLGRWAAEQPGFVSRTCYRDAASGRWTDIVAWTTRALAEAAMARSAEAAILGPVMSRIDPSSVSLGHFVRES